MPLNPAQPGQGCVVPFHDRHDINAGGPHGAANAQFDADNGITKNKMDGFVYQQETGLGNSCKSGDTVGVRAVNNCGLFLPGVNRHDVMGYHDASDIPSYWAYAQNFVLQDAMFEGVRGWSLASHLDLTSEWSAICTNPTQVSTCTSSPVGTAPSGTTVEYPWVNLFQLLDMHNVSWKYYLGVGLEPDCADDQMTCDPQVQQVGVLSLWNPLPGFAYAEAAGSAYIAAHNPDIDQFLVDVKNGALPQVSWIVPSSTFSEHPPSGITAGQEYVASLVNAIMQSPYWANTAIFVSWDDWGGFYDHVVPPVVDKNATKQSVQGYGFRVPGLLISAYAKKGYIDHSVLSTDSYATFIEDVFINGTRLDPTAMGQPDARPDIRDSLTSVTFPDGTTQPIGNLMNEFDFTQTPLPPLVQSTHVPTGITISCGSTDANNPQNCAAGTPVTVTWKAVAFREVPGPFTYQVVRDGTALGTCHVTKPTCVDSTAPAGVHMYRVYSVDSQKVASPSSAAAEADTQ